MNSNKKIAALYCRVSTFEQAQGNYSSLDGQEEMLKERCRQEGWSIYKIYRDTKSGTNLDREEITRLLDDAADKRFNVVLATKLDRISRSVKDFLELDEKLRKLDIDIVITTQPIDTTTPSGKMMRMMLLAFAEFERDMIAERTREKLYTQATQGIWGGGHPILGYDVKDKKLIINPEEKILVNKIFEYYLKTPSTAKVAQRINSEGYKTKAWVSKKGIHNGGGIFNNQHIHDILNNTKYIGKITYKREDFKGLHEAIISDELFNSVQAELKKSAKDTYATFTSSENLLLGLIECGCCGKKLTSSWGTSKTGAKHPYYKCTKKSKFGAVGCSARDLPKSAIEEIIEGIVRKIGTDRKFFCSVFKQMKYNKSEDLEKFEEREQAIHKNFSRLEKEQTNWFNFISGQSDLSSFPDVKNKLQGILHEKSQLEQQKNEIALQIDLIRRDSITEDELQQIFAEFAELYSELTPSMKQQLLKTLIIKIICFIPKKSKVGWIEIWFRGDGRVRKEWDITKKPEPLSSSFYVEWLRE